MPPRLIATDLDGTLLAPDGTISPRTARALHAVRAAGGEVVVCTARPVRWVRELLGALGLTGPVVCANGAVTWDLAADRALRCAVIDPAVAGEVVARLSTRVPGASWAVEAADAFGHDPRYAPLWPVPERTVVAPVAELLAGAPVVKLLCRRPDGSAPQDAPGARALVAELVELSWSEPSARLYEMSATGVTKGSALAALCAARGIGAHEVVAFGDMPNDLPMLRWAGRACAMGNSHPDVLAVADEVTDDNAADGVAAVLERIYGDG